MILPIYALKDKANPVKCLAKGHNKWSCWLVLHTIPLMLNVKQGSCEVNINFLRLLVWLFKGIEPRFTNCEVDAPNTRGCAGLSQNYWFISVKTCIILPWTEQISSQIWFWLHKMLLDI